MIKHNTELHQRAKLILPEGTRLTTDRFFKAKDTTSDIDYWKQAPNRRDLKGFDTPDAKEVPVDIGTVDLTNEPSGIQVLMSEPERFVDSTYASGRLLDEEKNNIYDFQSFISAVKRAWGSDSSLSNLLRNVTDEKAFKQMFEQKKVQEWIGENLGQKVIMKKLNVEPERAKHIWEKLSIRQRTKLLSKVNKKFRLKSMDVKTTTPKIIMIKQKSVKGVTYSRAKPRRFSDMEIEFIKSRSKQSYKEIIMDHNQFFGKKNQLRSGNSLKNKIYRLRRFH